MAIHTLTNGERYKIGKVNNTAVILESTDEAGSAYTLRPTQFICETSASVKINLQGSNISTAPVLWLNNTFNGTHSDCFIRFDSLVGAYAWVAGGDSSTDSFVIDRSTVVNSSAPSFIISGSTENVGLGTNKPTSKLHVVGTGNITSDTTIGGTLFCTKINTLNTDTLVEIGRTHVGYVGHSDCAGFSHIDQNSTTNYALLQSSAGNTFLNAKSAQKVYFRINNSDIATLDADGLGIGTSNPGFKLEVVGNNSGYVMRVHNDGNAANREGIKISCGQDSAVDGTSTGFITFEDGNGDDLAHITGDSAGTSCRFTGTAQATYSDIRNKRDIISMSSSSRTAQSILDEIDIIEYRYKSYDWMRPEFKAKLDAEVRIGVSAQAIESSSLAYTVYQSTKGNENRNPGDPGYKYKEVDYREMVPILIQAVKDQHTIIQDLKTRLDAAGL